MLFDGWMFVVVLFEPVVRLTGAFRAATTRPVVINRLASHPYLPFLAMMDDHRSLAPEDAPFEPLPFDVIQCLFASFVAYPLPAQSTHKHCQVTNHGLQIAVFCD